MRVVFNPFFEEALFDILQYMMQDSEAASLRFEEMLFEHLDRLSFFPYKFRQSPYYDNVYIRDYIFMGYTIPYLIDEKKNQIVILDIFKWQERPDKEQQ